MKKFFFRISILLFITAVFIYFISKNIGTIEKTVNITLSQSLGYLSLAAFFCVLAYILMSYMKKTLFDMMGIKRTLREMSLLQMQSLAINVLIPTGGLSTGVMFASDARKRGESEAAAITAVILSLLVDYVAIAFLLGVAVLYLLSLGTLGLPVAVSALAFSLLTVGLFLLIFLAGNDKPMLHKILDVLKAIINKILALVHKKKIGKDTMGERFILELENAYKAIQNDKKGLYRAFALILGSHFMYIIAIYVLFISLGISPLYRVLLSGYAIGMMFTVISPTPSGAGIVEGAMTLSYTSMGIPGGIAATTTLVYRGFYFWLPLIVGSIALQRKHFLELMKHREN